MASSCRFAFAVHTLAVLAHHGQADVSSGLLARSVNTNPVVIRRLLCDLRHAGLIQTQMGSCGGARLTRSPEEITLEEIFHAVEEGRPFSAHPQTPNQGCPVGRKIELVLGEVFASAQAALEQALAQRTLAEVLEMVNDDTAPRPLSGPALR